MMVKAEKKLKVTLIRSTNGALPNHKDCVRGLGLRRINSSSILKNDPCIQGMISKVSHLVAVEEV
jgi:large subunit ribosomal protein L30